MLRGPIDWLLAQYHPWANYIVYLGLVCPQCAAPLGMFATASIPSEKAALADAVNAALVSIARDGTYGGILQAWHLQAGAICPEDMQQNLEPGRPGWVGC